jgi:arabinose-5-phosphate isomerase
MGGIIGQIFRREEFKLSLNEIRRVVKTELEALNDLNERVDATYLRVLDLIMKCRGRVIVTGMGKSGIIAHKISATFSSTGTPSVYLNAAEAIHGDLGILRPDDLLMIISRSGITDELMVVLEHVRLLGVPIIGLLGNLSAPLATRCDVVIDASVREEACPFGLAPTSSTTTALVIGDALAVALISLRGFTELDFAFLHPGGVLGRRLTITIGNIMHTGSEIPQVRLNTSLQEVILEMTSKRLGATCVVDEQGKLVGIITDGDLRRLLEKTTKLNGICARDFMSSNPKTIKEDNLATSGINLMEKYNITQLVVLDGNNRVKGIVHLHDLLKVGIT